MSSMWRAAVILPALLAIAPSSSAQYAHRQRLRVAPAYSYRLLCDLDVARDWRRLRQSSGYRFADYARFLIANPDWPDEAQMRSWAENAMQPGENPATVLAFFAGDKPRRGNGWARLADAYAATGRTAPKRSMRRATPGRRPTSAHRRASDLEPLWRQASRARTTTTGSMPCCSPRRPTTRRAF